MAILNGLFVFDYPGQLIFPVMALVAVPLNGALVRYRAHYSPKHIQLDAEAGDGVAGADPIVEGGYFGMIKRVYRIEGIAGFYKGLMPTLIFATISIAYELIFFQSNCPSNSHAFHRISCLPSSTWKLIDAFLPFATTLFRIVFINRAIATPATLSLYNLPLGLRTLLSPFERRRPWILYTSPGLYLAVLSTVIYCTIIMSFALPFIYIMGTPLAPSIVLTALVNGAVLTPLEVVCVRLSIQKNHVSTAIRDAQQEGSRNRVNRGAEGRRVTKEDVIELKPDERPYTDLMDCVQRIITEEGWPTLYRASWATALLSLAVFPHFSKFSF